MGNSVNRISGCTDSIGLNYNPNANDDNNTCIYDELSTILRMDKVDMPRESGTGSCLCASSYYGFDAFNQDPWPDPIAIYDDNDDTVLLTTYPMQQCVDIPAYNNCNEDFIPVCSLLSDTQCYCNCMYPDWDKSDNRTMRNECNCRFDPDCNIGDVCVLKDECIDTGDINCGPSGNQLCFGECHFGIDGCLDSNANNYANQYDNIANIHNQDICTYDNTEASVTNVCLAITAGPNGGEYFGFSPYGTTWYLEDETTDIFYTGPAGIVNMVTPVPGALSPGQTIKYALNLPQSDSYFLRFYDLDGQNTTASIEVIVSSNNACDADNPLPSINVDMIQDINTAAPILNLEGRFSVGSSHFGCLDEYACNYDSSSIGCQNITNDSSCCIYSGQTYFDMPDLDLENYVCSCSGQGPGGGNAHNLWFQYGCPTINTLQCWNWPELGDPSYNSDWLPFPLVDVNEIDLACNCDGNLDMTLDYCGVCRNGPLCVDGQEICTDVNQPTGCCDPSYNITCGGCANPFAENYDPNADYMAENPSTDCIFDWGRFPITFSLYWWYDDGVCGGETPCSEDDPMRSSIKLYENGKFGTSSVSCAGSYYITNYNGPGQIYFYFTSGTKMHAYYNHLTRRIEGERITDGGDQIGHFYIKTRAFRPRFRGGPGSRALDKISNTNISISGETVFTTQIYLEYGNTFKTLTGSASGLYELIRPGYSYSIDIESDTGDYIEQNYLSQGLFKLTYTGASDSSCNGSWPGSPAASNTHYTGIDDPRGCRTVILGHFTSSVTDYSPIIEPHLSLSDPGNWWNNVPFFLTDLFYRKWDGTQAPADYAGYGLFFNPGYCLNADSTEILCNDIKHSDTQCTAQNCEGVWVPRPALNAEMPEYPSNCDGPYIPDINPICQVSCHCGVCAESLYACENVCPDALPGDINSDGYVDIQDVLYIINYMFGIYDSPNWPFILSESDFIITGDVNNDGLLNITDIIMIVQHILGNVANTFNISNVVYKRQSKLKHEKVDAIAAELIVQLQNLILDCNQAKTYHTGTRMNKIQAWIAHNELMQCDTNFILSKWLKSVNKDILQLNVDNINEKVTAAQHASDIQYKKTPLNKIQHSDIKYEFILPTGTPYAGKVINKHGNLYTAGKKMRRVLRKRNKK
jgi:hypothetical protein